MFLFFNLQILCKIENELVVIKEFVDNNVTSVFYFKYLVLVNKYYLCFYVGKRVFLEFMTRMQFAREAGFGAKSIEKRLKALKRD